MQGFVCNSFDTFEILEYVINRFKGALSGYLPSFLKEKLETLNLVFASFVATDGKNKGEQLALGSFNKDFFERRT